MKKGIGYSVPGFTASAVSAGLKKDGLLDLCLIFSQRQAVVAGMFTTNKVKAAPVLLKQASIKRGFARAVLTSRMITLRSMPNTGPENVPQRFESFHA